MLQPSPGHLSPDLWQALHGIKSIRVYSKGTTIFEQGTPAAGVYVVESGQVRLLLTTNQSRPQLLEVVGPGTILSLSESMSGNNHRVTAQAEDHATIAFVPRDSLLEFLRGHCDFCMQVVRLLSEDLHRLYHKFRSISAHPGRPRHRPPDEQLN
ncbi:MAG: cyclic nucleotide-binding domain-containing protein [Terriglobales bacterium]